MKKVTRIMSFSLSVLLLLTLSLTGCGNKASQTGSDSATANTSQTNASIKAEDTKVNLEPVDLTWYFVGNGEQADVKLIEDEVNKYIQPKINATIKLNCFDWGSYQQKRDMMIAAGEEMDIVFVGAWNGYWDLVAKGAFVDSTDLLDKYAPKAKNQLLPSLLNASKYKGRNYALPANKEAAHHYGLIMRKDIVDKYNLDTSSIKRVEDLEPLLKVVKEKEPGMIPFVVTNGDYLALLTRIDSIGNDRMMMGVDRNTTDFKIKFDLERPESLAMLELARKWFKLGYINKDAGNLATADALNKAGKVFSICRSLKPGAANEETSKNGFVQIQIDLTEPIVDTDSCTNSMQAISKSSENPERAMMFLDLFNTDVYLNNLINFGIEGKHYEKKSDTVIDFPAGLNASNSTYMPNTAWMFGNQFINYTWTTEDPKKWEQYKTYNENGKVSSILGFVFDQEKVKTEVSACMNVNKEFAQPLLAGMVDPDEYMPKYIDKLKAAGLEKIRSEMQMQLDNWIKANKK